jgi:hypothetical protein
MNNNRFNAGSMYPTISPYGGSGSSPLLYKPSEKKKNNNFSYSSSIPSTTPITNDPSGFVEQAQIAKPEYKVDPYKVQRDKQQAISQATTTAIAGAKALAAARETAKAGTKIATGLKIGKDGAVKAATGIGKVGTVGTAAASLGIGLAGAGMGFAGQKLEDKALERDNLKGYVGSQALEWAGKGMSAGSTIGGMILPGVGSLVGGAIGAVGGAIGGVIGGSIKKKKVLEERNQQKDAINRANELIKKQNTKYGIQARDRYKMQQIQGLEQQPMFKKGGKLAMPTLPKIPTFKNPYQKMQSSLLVNNVTGENVPKKEYLDLSSLTEDQQKQAISTVVSLYKDGNEPEKISAKLNIDPKIVINILQIASQKEQKRNIMPTSYKKGGKIEAKPNCSCGGKIKFKKGGKAVKSSCGCKPIFKRGGELDLKKENVILAGPSHEEENNTGVKGDKGLPVVKMKKGGAEKLAEVESLELMVNAASSQVIQELRKKAKAGDKKAIEELGKFLHEELEKNTYDYSKSLL